MGKKFTVLVTSNHPALKHKLLFSMEGSETKRKSIFTTLPGVIKKPTDGYRYELIFKYSHNDILGYKEKFLQSEDQLIQCMEMLLAE